MATSLPLGRLEAFDPQVETFTSYVEWTHLFFEANDIKEWRSVFLSFVGSAVYNPLQNLLAPVTPKNTPLQDIIAVLKAHYEPKPIVIAERCHFR